MERTNAELSWLRQMKKRLKSRSVDDRMPIILKKQNEIIQKLKEEQVNNLIFDPQLHLSFFFVYSAQNNMKNIKDISIEQHSKILASRLKAISWSQNKKEENWITKSHGGDYNKFVFISSPSMSINFAL